MQINKIKEIVNSNHSDCVKENLILNCLAHDKEVIPFILNIINIERNANTELIEDMNVELSRAHCYVIEAAIDKKKGGFCKNFIHSEIIKFYQKYKKRTKHLFFGTKWGDKHLKELNN